jgi:hypothetical protein
MGDYFRGKFNAANAPAVRTEFGGDTLKALNQLMDEGVLDRTLSHDLAGMGETDSRVYNNRHAKIMHGLSFMFHHAEVFNREVTALAAYRLARAAGRTHEQAVGEARDTVYESHFDYSAANKARFMQSDTARVLLMFRQFSLNMTYLLARNAHQSFKGEGPQVRKEARRKLTGMLGMHALAAGAMGMPLFSVVAAIMNALFDDPDEPYDFKTEFRNALADYLGPEMAEAIAKGPLSTFTGADLSSRVGLDGLWFRDQDRDLEGRGLVEYWLEQLAGPMFGIAASLGTAYDLIQEGQLERGIEAAVPKALKDGLRMLRYSREGVQTLRGDPIMEDVGGWESVLQGIGFTPARLANQYEANRALKGLEQRILDRRANLINRYALALHLQDQEMVQQSREAIQRFNQHNPTAAITAQTLRRSLRARSRYSRQAQHGMMLSKNLQGLTSEVRFALTGQ